MLKLSRTALACGITLLTLVAAAPAHALILTHVVGPMDNLYNTPWPGNPYFSLDPSLVGVPARSVESSGSPFDFSSFASIDVSATGCVVDAGPACTGPEGTPPSLFRGLIVYSMIGLWSSTGGAITPIGSPFDVGAARTLIVPGGGPAYLFLAENDGIFADNTAGQYDVTIRAEAVPEPTSLSLMALGGALAARRRRRRQA